MSLFSNNMRTIMICRIPFLALLAPSFFWLSFICGATASAQKKTLQPEPPLIQLVKPGGDTLLDPSHYNVRQRKQMMPSNRAIELKTARSQMKNGNHQVAADLLELLYRDFPFDPRVVTLLRECYIELKRYYSAIEILKRQAQNDPLGIQPLINLASVYFKANKTDSALLQIEFLMSHVGTAEDFRRNQSGAKQALRLLLENWQDSLALEYAAQLRQTADDSVVLADVVAGALERQKDFQGAVRESFKLIRADTSKAGRTRRKGDMRMAQLMNYPEAQPQVVEQLKLFIEQIPQDTVALKYLGELYMKTEQFDPAYDLYVSADSLIETDGRRLLTYMRECSDRKLYAQVRKMGEYLLENHPKSPTIVSARFILARALQKENEPEKAISAFYGMLDEPLSPVDKAEALFRAGDILMNDLERFDSSRSVFLAVMTINRNGSWSSEADFRLFQLDLIDGNLNGAKSRLEALSNRRMNVDLAEKIVYYQARLALFEADIDSARTGYKRVIERYARGFYVNDALGVLMVLQQGAEGPLELLNLYASAEYFKERRIEDSLINTLILLSEHEDTTLADVALLDLGRIYLKRSDTTASLRKLNTITQRFPGSYFAPYARKLQGDIYLNDKNRQAEALAIYRSLLKEYGTYPFSAELRQKLKEATGEDFKPGKDKGKKTLSDA